jgi:thiol-disulfide isomerase/thioredoxin
MKRLNQALLVSIAALMLFQGKALFAGENKPLPWHLLPRIARLGGSQQAAFLEVLRSEQNYGDCKESLYDCLTKEKPDPTAVRVANFGAYVISKGVPPRNLWRFISDRATFAGQEITGTFSFEETPTMGNPGAKIILIEFASFKCPYCVAFGSKLKKLVEESGGQVRLYLKHFPSKTQPGSALASRAAQAAHRQGKFWEMYDRLFSDMNRQGMEDLILHASEIALDVERFKRDLEDPTLISIIERDVMEGMRADVKGTPTLFINGKIYHLIHDDALLKDIINEEAERLGIYPPYEEWRYE